MASSKKKPTQSVPSKKSQASGQKRRSIRFPSDEGAQAFILGDGTGKKFKTPIPALLVEESYKGCSLVVLQNDLFQEGESLHVQVGKLDPMFAEIRWVKSYAKKILLLGLNYLD